MLKYIGIFLISVSVSAYGAVLSRQLKDALAIRKEITVLLKSIEHGIKYGSKPISEILSGCTLHNLRKCGFIDALADNSIEFATETYLGILTQDERKKICDFFNNLGRSSYREKELEYCKGFIEYFENCERSSEKEVAAKAVLYSKIGIICGILAAIILI